MDEWNNDASLPINLYQNIFSGIISELKEVVQDISSRN